MQRDKTDCQISVGQDGQQIIIDHLDMGGREGGFMFLKVEWVKNRNNLKIKESSRLGGFTGIISLIVQGFSIQEDSNKN